MRHHSRFVLFSETRNHLSPEAHRRSKTNLLPDDRPRQRLPPVARERNSQTRLPPHHMSEKIVVCMRPLESGRVAIEAQHPDCRAVRCEHVLSIGLADRKAAIDRNIQNCGLPVKVETLPKTRR